MKKFDHYLLKIFLMATLPVWLVLGISYFRGYSDNWFNTMTGILIVSWILCIILILIKMILRQSFREKVLNDLLRLKVNDEREEAISGLAARNGQLFLISIICVLLFFSILKISLVQPGKDMGKLGNKGSITIEFDYSLVNKEAIKKDQTEFSLKELPISKEGILTLMLLFQLSSYHFYFRKKMA